MNLIERDHAQGVASDQRITFSNGLSSMTEFWDLVSIKGSIRVVAPAGDVPLAKLTAAFGTNAVDVKEAVEIYARVSGLPAKRTGSLLFFESPLRGISLSPPSGFTTEVTTAAFRLIGSLSHDQVDQMYAQHYVTTSWLSPSQHDLYADLVRKIRLFDKYTNPPPSTLDTGAIMRLPVRFLFSYCASFLLVKPDGQEAFSWIGAYDYGRGLIRFPPAPKSRGLPCQDAGIELLGSCGAEAVDSHSSPPSPQSHHIEILRTQALGLQDISMMMARAAGSEIHVDKRLHDLKVVITKGTYQIDELIESIPATLGIAMRRVGEVYFFAARDQDIAAQRSKALNELAEKVRAPLQRLPWRSSVPFPRYVFENQQQIPFSKLSEAQREFIRERVTNENNAEYDMLDLKRCEIKFAETLWFEGLFGDPTATGLRMFEFQIW